MVMMMRTRPRTSGFTLIELMITVVVLGIIAGLGIPSLQNYILQTRVKTGSQALYTSLLYARSEAVKRNTDIFLYSSDKSATGWDDGWFVTTNAARTYSECQDNESGCLRVQEPLGGLSVTTAAANVTYENDGRVAATATFDVCDSDGSAVIKKRQISITLTGRPTLDYDGNCS